MHTQTGDIFDPEGMKQFVQEFPEQVKHIVPVVRDLSERELADRQILLYSPCGCGSGKKFKFCCFKLTRQEFARKLSENSKPLPLG